MNLQAGELRDREMELKAQISAITEKGKEQSKAESEAGEVGPTVEESDIQQIVCAWTGIPVEKVSTDESDRLPIKRTYISQPDSTVKAPPSESPPTPN